MKRQRVIQEIKESEESYCACLDQLVNNLVIPLKTTQVFDHSKQDPSFTTSQSKKELHKSSTFSTLFRPKPIEIFVTPTEHAMAFSNIREIYALSKEILSNLKQEDAPSPATIFLLYKERLSLVYETYVGNYETNMITLAKLHRRPGFSDYATCQLNGIQLSSFCISPVQRVPRYLMLLNELLKQTIKEDANSSEITILKKAIVSIENVCQFINGAKGHLEQVKIILDIEKECDLDGCLVRPRRRLLIDGELLKVCRKRNKRFHFWLFNDMLMYGQKRTLGGYDISHRFSLEFVQVREIDFVTNVTTKETNPALEFKSTKKSFIVICEDTEEKLLWLNNFKISKARVKIQSKRQRFRSYMRKTRIEKLRDLRGSGTTRNCGSSSSIDYHEKKVNSFDEGSRHIAPVWVQDIASKECQKCGDKFTLLKRRHHCRMCGSLVCHSCSTNRAHIPTETKMVRVCDPCIMKMKLQSGVVATPNDGTTVVMNPFNVMEQIAEENNDDDDEVEIEEVQDNDDDDNDDDENDDDENDEDATAVQLQRLDDLELNLIDSSNHKKQVEDSVKEEAKEEMEQCTEQNVKKDEEFDTSTSTIIIDRQSRRAEFCKKARRSNRPGGQSSNIGGRGKKKKRKGRKTLTITDMNYVANLTRRRQSLKK
jgi:hypothetical protein